MNNEKLMILKMLESGQINATEASNLLKAVENPDGGASTPHSPPPTPSASSPPPHTPPPRAPHSSHAGYGNNGPRHGSPSGHSGSHGTSGFEASIDDLGRKFESFARDMAPKVQKFTETMADKIMGAADKMSGAFAESSHDHAPHSQAPAPSQSHRPAPPRPSAPSPSGMTERSIEMLVETGGYNELSLSGLNGEVRIKGYNGDKITAKLTYRAKSPHAPIEMMKLGNKYFLKYEADDFQGVSIDAYVPERAFGVIKIDGINCQIDCSSLAAGDMRIVNANGNTRLSALAATNLTAESSNGNFVISNTNADNATIENLNGTLETHELDIANLKLTNYNGPLSIIMSGFNRHAEYLWNVETGNAKLSMNLPTMPDLGYHIKAHAAMSEIKLGLTGLQFLINEPSLVEARSVHFDSAAKRVKLAVETSNAPLVIN